MSGCQGSMLSVLTVSPCLQMYVMTVAACLQNTTSFRESPLQTEWKYLLQVKLLLLLQLHVMETRKRFFSLSYLGRKVSAVILLKASQRQTLTEEGSLQINFCLSNFITFHHGEDTLHHFHGITQKISLQISVIDLFVGKKEMMVMVDQDKGGLDVSSQKIKDL